jgi:dienelactone hydrolase
MVRRSVLVLCAVAGGFLSGPRGPSAVAAEREPGELRTMVEADWAAQEKRHGRSPDSAAALRDALRRGRRGCQPAAEGAGGARPGRAGESARTPSTPATSRPAAVPSRLLQAEGDPNKPYFLIGPRVPSRRPARGYRLLIVLPGGSGGKEFHPFVKNIARRALPAEYVVVQPIARRWDARQAKRLVWPTETQPWPGMRFSTEAYVEAVVRDVGKRHRIDGRFVFALGWSSGGPPCYALSLRRKPCVTGTFVAMSVFHPRGLPPLSRARGHAYYLLHSPQDFIPIAQARLAETELRKHGASTRLVTYAGGHGWRGDVFGSIRAGIAWLEQAAAKGAPATRATSRPSTGRPCPAAPDPAN